MISVERVSDFVYYYGADTLEFDRSLRVSIAFGDPNHCIPILFQMDSFHSLKMDLLQKALSILQMPFFLNSFASELGA